jgi:hypothetical protein
MKFWKHQFSGQVVKSETVPSWGYPELWFEVSVRQWRRYKKENK